MKKKERKHLVTQDHQLQNVCFPERPCKRPFPLEWSSSSRALHFDSPHRKFSSCQLENNIPMWPFGEEVPTTGDRLNRIPESIQIIMLETKTSDHTLLVLSSCRAAGWWVSAKGCLTWGWIQVQPSLKEYGRLPRKLLPASSVPNVSSSRSLPGWHSVPIRVQRSRQGSPYIVFLGLHNSRDITSKRTPLLSTYAP